MFFAKKKPWVFCASVMKQDKSFHKLVYYVNHIKMVQLGGSRIGTHRNMVENTSAKSQRIEVILTFISGRFPSSLAT